MGRYGKDSRSVIGGGGSGMEGGTAGGSGSGSVSGSGWSG